MYREENGSSWFDWVRRAAVPNARNLTLASAQTMLLTFLLIATTTVSTVLLFSHTRVYHLHAQPQPVGSPHARFVREPAPSPPLAAQVRAHLWAALCAAVRFLFNWTRIAGGGPSVDGSRRVQALEVWDPSELELGLFCMYSPVHALLWFIWNSSNWMAVSLVMVGVSVQVRVGSSPFAVPVADGSI
jgi:hypothetical protein